MTLRRLSFVCLWFACAGRAAADVTLADFEADLPVQTSSNVSAQRVETDSPQGSSHLRLSMKPDGLAAGVMQLSLPADASFEGADRLEAFVRVRDTGQSRILRWVAFDDRGKPIFQRRFELKPGETWVRLEEPLRQWRWHDANPGSWKEVRQLGLRIETPAAAVEVDDIRLVVPPRRRSEPNGCCTWRSKLAQSRSTKSRACLWQPMRPKHFLKPTFFGW